MKIKILLALFIMSVFLTYANCQTQDNNIFTLPETPPTIQKLDKTPLDKPILRRQAFVSDEELTLSPVWISNDFGDIENKQSNFSAGVYGGNFETIGAFANYQSTAPFTLNAKYANSAGENKLFALEKNDLNIQYNNFVGKYVFVSAGAQANKVILNEQSKTAIGARVKLHSYFLKDLSVETDLGAKEFSLYSERNNLLSAGIIAKCLPLSDTLAMFKFYVSQNSGFFDAKNYYTVEFFAQSIFSNKLAAGAGFNLRNAHFALNGNIIYKLSDILSSSFGFESGLQELLWSKIYGKDKYYSLNNNLINPENKYELTQTLACNISEKYIFSATVFQQSKENSLALLYLASNNTVVPCNIPRSYDCGVRVAAQYNGAFSLKAEAEKIINRSSELISQQSSTLSAEFALYNFKFKPAYTFVPEIYYDYNLNVKTSAYNNAALFIERPLSKTVTLTFNVENIMGDKQEVQPNFITKEAKYEAGLVVNF